MIVCVCNRVSDRDITRHAQQGCSSFEDLQFELGVATCCGCCEHSARKVYQEAAGAQGQNDRPSRAIPIMPTPVFA